MYREVQPRVAAFSLNIRSGNQQLLCIDDSCVEINSMPLHSHCDNKCAVHLRQLQVCMCNQSVFVLNIACFLLRIKVEERNVKTCVNCFGGICFELYLGDLYVIAT